MLMQELLEKRTTFSKHFDNQDGTFTSRVGLSPLHYPDDNTGLLVDIDVKTAEDHGTYWAFKKAQHRLLVAKDFGASQLIRFDSKKADGVNNRTIFFEPTRIVWLNNPDLSDMVVFRNALPVIGVLTDNKITYANAFGPGIDYEIVFGPQGIMKNLVINAKNNLELPPTPQHKLVLLSKFTGGGMQMMARGMQQWDKAADYDTEADIEITETDGQKFYMRKANIWDAADERQDVRVLWMKRNNTLWQGKILPKAFLQNAKYPVRTDTVIDTYDATNSKQVVYDAGGGTYASIQGAATGTNVYTLALATHNILHNSKISTQWYIRRADLQFDTSALPTGATVTAATLTMYAAGTGGGDTDGESIVIVNNSDNSNLSDPIVTEDYNDFTTASQGSRDITDFFNAGANVSITFTDFSAIKVGAGAVSRIGLRTSGDTSATQPTGSNLLRVDFGTDAPYLDVTYSLNSGIHRGMFALVEKA